MRDFFRKLNKKRTDVGNIGILFVFANGLLRVVA